MAKNVPKNMANYKDDEMNIIINDIEKIRNRPNMYNGALGDKGCLHLCKEIIDNNRDECSKKESPGDTVDIFITDKYIISSDNGRGIPTNLLQVVHETNQAGSNMVRAHGMTSGENGSGSTIYTALSKELVIKTFRPTEHKTLQLIYNEGKLVDKQLDDKYDKPEHGMSTKFTPSKKILGVDRIPVEELINWLNDFEYTLPKSIHMKYKYGHNGETVHIIHRTLDEYFNKFIPEDKRMSQPIVISGKGKLKEIVQEKVYNRTFNIEVSIMYSTAEYKDEDIRKSWMNMIYTANNGAHMNGAIAGISKYLSEKVVNKNKRYENEDLKKDILSHLQIVVKTECDIANMFNSQEKSQVGSKALYNEIVEAVYQGMVDFADSSRMNGSRVEDLIDIVIANNRVRREGEKARTINSATRIKNTWTRPDALLPCSSAKTPEGKELYLVEGKSAGGGLEAARDARFQAILRFRGKSLNVYDVDLPRVLKSDTWLNLIKVLGCGIGAAFDINKLNYDKIIIATDADIDGYHIRVGFCTFFVKYMPEIIKAGKLYIAEPPLYKLINGKQVSYVASQLEYIDECINSVGDLKITFEK